jgi:predicted RNase H-like nuclease (RuvC/YqgF family)
MTETTVVHTDLDLLAERVEKAAAIVQRLRDEKQQLERDNQALAARLEQQDRVLQGNEPTSLMNEIQALRKEQRLWEGERREVATRIETLVRKLERLEA